MVFTISSIRVAAASSIKSLFFFPFISPGKTWMIDIFELNASPNMMAASTIFFDDFVKSVAIKMFLISLISVYCKSVNVVFLRY